MASSTSPLPPLLDRWMRDVLDGPLPSERRATCDDCAMCPQPGETTPDHAVFYNPTTKCCTFMPTLWNFQVGALLADASPEAAAGRRTVEARLEAGIAVSPLGCLRPPVYQAAYGLITGSFGQVPSMRCPHYLEEGGRCGVWRARESTCATWFCKHERGALGKEFWERVHHLLGLAEEAVARWVVLELDVGSSTLASLLPIPAVAQLTALQPEDFEGARTPAARARAWGQWAGRERAFFLEAHALVAQLRWEDVRALGGVELWAAERVVQSVFARHRSRALPRRLVGGYVESLALPDGGMLVTSYAYTDPLRLSPMVVAALRFFDGRPVAAARAACEAEAGVLLDPALVRRLVDFGILEEPDGLDPPGA